MHEDRPAFGQRLSELAEPLFGRLAELTEYIDGNTIHKTPCVRTEMTVHRSLIRSPSFIWVSYSPYASRSSHSSRINARMPCSRIPSPSDVAR